jgi:hypothetical protein
MQLELLCMLDTELKSNSFRMAQKCANTTDIIGVHE